MLFIHKIPSIQLAKFDIGGVLYHANYFLLYEETREAFLAEIGMPYPELVKEGSHLAVVESHQEFKKPIYYGDEISVELTTTEVKSTSATFHYTFRNSSPEIIHSAWTRQTFVKNTEGEFKPERFPELLKSAILELS